MRIIAVTAAIVLLGTVIPVAHGSLMIPANAHGRKVSYVEGLLVKATTEMEVLGAARRSGTASADFAAYCAHINSVLGEDSAYRIDCLEDPTPREIVRACEHLVVDVATTGDVGTMMEGSICLTIFDMLADATKKPNDAAIVANVIKQIKAAGTEGNGHHNAFVDKTVPPARRKGVKVPTFERRAGSVFEHYANDNVCNYNEDMGCAGCLKMRGQDPVNGFWLGSPSGDHILIFDDAPSSYGYSKVSYSSKTERCGGAANKKNALVIVEISNGQVKLQRENFYGSDNWCLTQTADSVVMKKCANSDTQQIFGLEYKGSHKITLSRPKLSGSTRTKECFRRTEGPTGWTTNGLYNDGVNIHCWGATPLIHDGWGGKPGSESLSACRDLCNSNDECKHFSFFNGKDLNFHSHNCCHLFSGDYCDPVEQYPWVTHTKTRKSPDWGSCDSSDAAWYVGVNVPPSEEMCNDACCDLSCGILDFFESVGEFFLDVISAVGDAVVAVAEAVVSAFAGLVDAVLKTGIKAALAIFEPFNDMMARDCSIQLPFCESVDISSENLSVQVKGCKSMDILKNLQDLANKQFAKTGKGFRLAGCTASMYFSEVHATANKFTFEGEIEFGVGFLAAGDGDIEIDADAEIEKLQSKRKAQKKQKAAPKKPTPEPVVDKRTGQKKRGMVVPSYAASVTVSAQKRTIAFYAPADIKVPVGPIIVAIRPGIELSLTPTFSLDAIPILAHYGGDMPFKFDLNSKDGFQFEALNHGVAIQVGTEEKPLPPISSSVDICVAPLVKIGLGQTPPGQAGGMQIPLKVCYTLTFDLTTSLNNVMELQKVEQTAADGFMTLTFWSWAPEGMCLSATISSHLKAEIAFPAINLNLHLSMLEFMNQFSGLLETILICPITHTLLLPPGRAAVQLGIPWLQLEGTIWILEGFAGLIDPIPPIQPDPTTLIDDKIFEMTESICIKANDVPFEPLTVEGTGCVLDKTTNCVSSANYPNNYPNSAQCSIIFNSAHQINSAAFLTESDSDKLTIGGTAYSGVQKIALLKVQGGEVATWSSDGMVTKSGWKICAQAFSELMLGDSSCVLDDNGCVSSHFNPSTRKYNANEECNIDVTRDGVVTSTSFDTEAGYDFLTIGGQSFHGTNGPKMIPVTAGSTIHWKSDHSIQGTGWKICPSTKPTHIRVGDGLCKENYGPRTFNGKGGDNQGTDEEVIERCAASCFFQQEPKAYAPWGAHGKEYARGFGVSVEAGTRRGRCYCMGNNVRFATCTKGWTYYNAYEFNTPTLHQTRVMPKESCDPTVKNLPWYTYNSEEEARQACIKEGCLGLGTKDEQKAAGSKCVSQFTDGGVNKWYMETASSGCGGSAGWNTGGAYGAAFCVDCPAC